MQQRRCDAPTRPRAFVSAFPPSCRGSRIRPVPQGSTNHGNGAVHQLILGGGRFEVLRANGNLPVRLLALCPPLVRMLWSRFLDPHQISNWQMIDQAPGCGTVAVRSSASFSPLTAAACPPSSSVDGATFWRTRGSRGEEFVFPPSASLRTYAS
jgi:hypothetical protein